MPIPLIIWGASGHAAVVAEAVRASNVYTVAGFIDDDDARTGTEYFGSTILGTRETLAWLALQGHRHIIFGFGDCAARRDLTTVIAELGFTAATVVHPSAIVSPSAELEPGVFVAAGAIIGTRTRVGAHTIVNTGAILDHDCEIAAAVHIAPGVKLAGGVRVGAAAWVGLGACVLENRRIGANAMIGAGAVVVKDIPPRALAYGVPATVQRSLSETLRSAKPARRG
ncbi:acetyltransferase [soil metagenome]